MKRILSLIAVLVLVSVVMAGCSYSGTSDDKQRAQQEQILQQATDKVGMPNVTNFFERETLRKIIELRDRPDLTTYAYKEQMNGKFIYVGRAIGFGIPYATQFTNPEKPLGTSSYEASIIKQADPNGLFSPDSAEATWLLLVNEQTNEPEIIYFEPKLVVTQSKMPRRLVEDWSLPANY